MSTAKRLVTVASSILLCASILCAQEQNPATTTQFTIPVTAAATADRVRFTAPSTVVEMRLEVYGANGEKVFENEIRGGNVADWPLRNEKAEPLADGSYLCVVTVKSLAGKITKRIGSATIEKAAATLQTAVASQLTPQQAQALGPMDDDASLILLKEDERQTTTVIAHNGEDGLITRGRGALSFRIGDFFRGKDIEQVRLTPEGNLGIGLTQPQAKLDVDGLIRSSQGIVFPDGSVQFSAARKTFGAGSLMPGQSQHTQGQDAGPLLPDISGTGTTGRISKWLDGPNGVLNDSNITEASGAIGINGAPSTSFRLDVNGSTRIRGSNPGFNLEGLSAGGNIWVFQSVDDDGRFRLFGQDNVNPGLERLTISLATGNVGIGATAPQYKLHVVGQDARVEGNSASILPRFSLNFTGGLTDEKKWQNYASPKALTFSALNDVEGAETIWLQVNRGIGKAIPSVVLPNGNVGIGATAPAAKLDIQGGADNTGANDPQAMAFQYRTGGFRHWIRTRHSAALGSGNAIDFFLNNSSSPGGSTGPGAGSVHLMTLDSGRVGIGTASPLYKFHVKTGTDQHLVVRPGSDFSLSLNGIALQSINDGNSAWMPLNLEGSQLTLNVGSGGNVGIGTPAPGDKLTVAGRVQSTSGGFKFPDGTVQTTAANSTYTSFRDSNTVPIGILGGGGASGISGIIVMTVPTGIYQVLATVEFINNVGGLGNNSRRVSCWLSNGGTNPEKYSFDIAGTSRLTTSFHSVLNASEVSVDCFHNGPVFPGGEVQAATMRITATKIEGTLVVQSLGPTIEAAAPPMEPQK